MESKYQRYLFYPFLHFILFLIYRCFLRQISHFLEDTTCSFSLDFTQEGRARQGCTLFLHLTLFKGNIYMKYVGSMHLKDARKLCLDCFWQKIQVYFCAGQRKTSLLFDWMSDKNNLNLYLKNSLQLICIVVLKWSFVYLCIDIDNCIDFALYSSFFL